jgi:hypothetical protein
MRNRYYIRTRYHLWTVMRRCDANLDPAVIPDSYKDDVIQHFGARGRGDAAARATAQELCDQLNERESD